jgi:hypothetical protein
MSRVETHVGKLRKVDTGNLTVKEWCINERKAWLEKNPRFGPWAGDEYWKDDFYDVDKNWKKYLFYGDELYETFDHIEADEADIDIMTDNGDGTFSFVMQFYNGGTCLQECLEDGLKRLNKI